MATIIDGKALAEEIKREIKLEVDEMLASGEKEPHLAVILVGENRASQTYVRNKIKSCEQVGFKSSLIKMEAGVSEEKLLSEVHRLNNDPDITGFIVQTPLPKHISETKVLLAVNPKKDVDGFHPENLGRMAKGLPAFISATPLGITKMLERTHIETKGKHCVVIGRSNIVGLPMSLLMIRNDYPGNATVTICHSRTRNLKEICLQADILIAAIGKPKFVTEDMIKEDAVVIDVGINAVEDSTKKSGYRLVGDVDFANVARKCSYITPVPGGVGPMTVAALLMNTLKAAKEDIFSIQHSPV